jgi:outer membrane protein assembly factor BamB
MADDDVGQETNISPSGRYKSTRSAVSRRTVIVGLIGVFSAEVLASGITWRALLKRLQPPPLTHFTTPSPGSLHFSWPMFGFSLQHTRFNPNENVLNSSNVALLTILWTAATGSSISSSPAIVDNVVYLGSNDNRLYAFNVTTGATLWVTNTGGSISSSPAVAKGLVYVGSQDGKLYACDASTGLQLWASSPMGPISSSPAVVNGTVYVGSQDGKLYAFQQSFPIQLKSHYSGTASGYAGGSVTFTLISEDQQGNLSMQTTFQQAADPQKTAIYSCQGSITTDRHINLQCTSVSDQSYVLTVQGNVYADGHMEGTEQATNTNDSSYDHLYSWKAY